MNIEINGKEYNVVTCPATDYSESMKILSNIDDADNNIASTAIIEIMNKALDNTVTIEEIKDFDAATITKIILMYFDMQDE
jgi:uncharacterized protein